MMDHEGMLTIIRIHPVSNATELQVRNNYVKLAL